MRERAVAEQAAAEKRIAAVHPEYRAKKHELGAQKAEAVRQQDFKKAAELKSLLDRPGEAAGAAAQKKAERHARAAQVESEMQWAIAVEDQMGRSHLGHCENRLSRSSQGGCRVYWR